MLQRKEQKLLLDLCYLEKILNLILGLMGKDTWTHGGENFEIFASERRFQETLKESKVDIFIQQIFLRKR